MTKSKLFQLHKIVVVVAALAQLCLSVLHNNGLVLLENQISGFVMFMFVLLSLVCLFNVTRIKDTTIKGMLSTLIFDAITIGFGIWLSILYIGGLSNSNYSTTPVLISLILTVGVLASIVASLVFLMLSKFAPEEVELQDVKNVEV